MCVCVFVFGGQIKDGQRPIALVAEGQLQEVLTWDVQDQNKKARDTTWQLCCSAPAAVFWP